jgi:hypothetical protein
MKGAQSNDHFAYGTWPFCSTAVRLGEAAWPTAANWRGRDEQVQGVGHVPAGRDEGGGPVLAQPAGSPIRRGGVRVA